MGAVFSTIVAGIKLAITAFAKKYAVAYAITKFVVTALVTATVSRVIAKRAGRGANAGGGGGGRIQLPPATDNKIPVVYGSAFMGGPIVDAKITYDQKTMWFVIALAEVTDTTAGSGYTFGDIYYDGKLVTFDGMDPAKVVSLTTNTTPAQVDTKVNNYLWIYLFPNGSSDGVTPLAGSNTQGLTGPDILSDINIPNPWTSSNLMTNCAYAIVKVIFNTDAGTTGLGALNVEVINNLNKPGDAIKDYMINTRYGCAIPTARIDDASLTALNIYSDQSITYITTASTTATQARYRINGPIDTGNNCLENLQVLVDACDSWLQYSALTGQWRVIMNAPITTSTSSLYLVDSSNLIGGIQINPIDLNETYNEVEVAYPNKNIKDQTDYQVIMLEDYQVGVMSPNEAVNRLNFNLPVVNEAVQAKYLAVRRLLQSREDITIQMALDFSGIQIQAGDVIRVTHAPYGWVDKLFRVSSVSEEQYTDGTLGAQVVAFEYNGTIYADNSIQDYVPAFNTGLTDPNVISVPIAPTITPATITSGTVSIDAFIVTGTVPDTGTIIYMDFNYGTTSTVSEHIQYRTIQNGNGTPFLNTSTVDLEVTTLPAGNYYWSITARNNTAGRQSTASNVYSWAGPTIPAYNTSTNEGGIPPGWLQPGSVTTGTLAPGVVTSATIGPNSVVAGTIAPGAVVTGTIAGNAVIPGTIAVNAVGTGTIATGAVIAGTIATDAVIAENIATNAIISDKIAANAVIVGKIAADAVTATNISANAVIAGKIAADAVTATNISAEAIVAGKIAAGAVTATNISVGTLEAISANMGNLTSGNIKTANTGFRLELSSFGDFPIWYGSGTKDAANAAFYLKSDGTVYISGVINAQPGSNIPIPTTATFAISIASITKTESGFAATGNVQSGLAVVDVVNGVAPITYVWSKIADLEGTTNISSTSTVNPYFFANNVPDGTAYTSHWRLEATDANSAVATATVFTTLVWIDLS